MTGRARAALPIDAALPEILERVRRDRRLVLVAPPGAGKTTRVPPAIVGAGLLDPRNPNLICLQPRRVAARSVAARIAEENGWAIGEEVGYQVRFERRIGPRTRIRVVTEGILNRQLVNDPYLEGVGAVVIDEFHERSVHSDLAIALLKEIRESVRDDLIVVVMSATLDPGPVSRFLGDAPVIRVEGRAFPVEVVHRPSAGEPLADRMARAIEDELRGSAGAGPGSDLLAFLPGVEEIRQTARRLGTRDDALVLPLHGSLTPDEQDRAIRPSPRRKVILATNIAETSLTIDGVSVVIDGGQARRASYDADRGIDRLVLERISRASAGQRAGRAGRTRPGRCVRLWSDREERGMPEADLAEIHRIDLAPTLLALHAWGYADPSTFGWFEPPAPDRIAAAERTLTLLGAIDGAGAVTEVGRRLLDVPAPPRLARLLLEAHRWGLARQGAAVAAILAERDILLRPERGGGRGRSEGPGASDVLIRLDRLAEAEARRFAPSIRDLGIDPMAARRASQARDDLLRAVRRWPDPGSRRDDEDDAMLEALLVAFPDRVCRRRKGDDAAGLMVGGRGVRLEPDSVVREPGLFLAIDPRDDRGRPGGVREARVRVASEVRPEWLFDRFPRAIERAKSARYDEARGRVVGVQEVRFLGLTIEESEHVAVDAGLAGRVLAAAMTPRGWGLIREDEAAASWLARYAMVRSAVPELGLPEWGDDDLAEVIEAAYKDCRSPADRRASWVDLLRGRLSYDRSRAVEELAPESIAVPSGNKVRLSYREGEPPVLAVRLQELFGWLETPRIARGRVRVVLHLLGPNFRPVQITEDLASFWSSAYFQVRKDLRNRYPKHSWPEDPLTAKAEARGGRRTT